MNSAASGCPPYGRESAEVARPASVTVTCHSSLIRGRLGCPEATRPAGLSVGARCDSTQQQSREVKRRMPDTAIVTDITECLCHKCCPRPVDLICRWLAYAAVRGQSCR